MNQEVKCNRYDNYYYIVWETEQPRWQVFVFYETFSNHFWIFLVFIYLRANAFIEYVLLCLSGFFCLLSDEVHKERWYKLFLVPRSINQIDYILIVSDWIFVIVSQNDSHQAGTGHSLASGWSPPRSADVSRCENLNFISHLYHGLPEIRSSSQSRPSHTTTRW